jgi:hypothetical protein
LPIKTEISSSQRLSRLNCFPPETINSYWHAFCLPKPNTELEPIQNEHDDALSNKLVHFDIFICRLMA